MARPLRELFAEFTLKIKGLQKLLDANEGLDKTAKTAKKADKSLSGLGDTFQGIGAAISAAVGLEAIASFTSEVMKNTEELYKWSQRLNISIVDFTALSNVTSRYGVDLDDLTDAMKELQLKAQDALSSGKKSSQAEMYKRIGISLNDLRPVVNDASAMFDLFHEKISRVNDEGLRNFTVDELMSDAGTRMLPIFRLNSKELEKLRKNEEKRARNVEKLSRLQTGFRFAMNRSKQSLEAIAILGATQLLPTFQWIIDKTEKLLSSFEESANKTNIFKAALIGLGAIAAAFAISTIGIWGPILLGAAAITVIIFAINDLVTAFQGGESLIGGFLNAFGILFDMGPIGTQFFAALRGGWKILNNLMNEGMSLTDALDRVFMRLWEHGGEGSKFAAVLVAAFQIVYGGIQGLLGLLHDFMLFLENTWWPILGSVFGFVLDGIRSIINAFAELVGIKDSLSGIPIIGKLLEDSEGGTTETTTGPRRERSIFLPELKEANQRGVVTNNSKGGTNVNAGVSVSIGSINEATDINRVRREITEASRNAADQQARRIQGALVQR